MERRDPLSSWRACLPLVVSMMFLADAPDHRNPGFVFQAYAAGSARDHFDHAFPREGAEMLLGCVRRLEAQRGERCRAAEATRRDSARQQRTVEKITHREPMMIQLMPPCCETLTHGGTGTAVVI